MRKKISIIVPCYNMSAYLDRCWKSLENQTIGIANLECIFINDMSDDDGATWNKLLEIDEKAPDSVVIVNMDKKGGPGGCRNVGISYATGEYLQFFDADDELTPDACERLYDIATNNSADIVQFNHLNIMGNKRWSSGWSGETKLYSIKNKIDRIPFLVGNTVSYGITNKLYKMDLVREANVFFPENLRYEEPLFVYPLFLYAKRVFLLRDELYIYHRRQGSIVTSEVGRKLLDHPTVQLMLLEELMKKRNLYDEYKDAIEIYFLWSFYCETLKFAGIHKGAYLPLDYFKQMQNVCLQFCGNWKENPLLGKNQGAVWDILESITENIGTQGQLNDLIEKAAKYL